MRSMQQILGHGRLSGTGYVSILPVDQGIEHSAGASFAPNPVYFDPGRSWSWRSKAGATRSPPRSACWDRCRADSRTGSPSW